MKIYLAGPITGVADFFEVFAFYANKLRMDGHEVFNPTHLRNMPLRQIMSHEMRWLCEEAEAIALMPGWANSKGATIEFQVAKYLGHKVLYL